MHLSGADPLTLTHNHLYYCCSNIAVDDVTAAAAAVKYLMFTVWKSFNGNEWFFICWCSVL